MIELTIPGRPLGKQRHQTAIRGKGEKAFTHEYTPIQTVNYETYVKVLFNQKYPDHTPWERDVPLVCYLEAYYPIPASFNGSKRNEAVLGMIQPCTKPDLDNITKVIWDALNQIAYADDSQIVQLFGYKYYSEKPEVLFSLQTMAEYRIRISEDM